MGKVSIAELEKIAAQPKEEARSIETKKIGDVKIYRGPYVDQWYDDYDECMRINQKAEEVRRFKELGRDEDGRTPAQVRFQAAKQALQKEREGYLKKAAEIGMKMASLKIEDFEVKKKGK
jgi:hypothetical protein